MMSGMSPSIKKNLFSVLAAQDKLENSVFESRREFCTLKVNNKVMVLGE